MPSDSNGNERTLAALREAERLLRNIVEHSTNLFYVHTTDHILTYVSPQSRQFFGCEPEEAQVRWTELITDHPANRLAIEATQRAIDTGERQPPYQVECLGPNGRRIWVEVNETPVVENGRTVAIVGSLTDITGRRLAEQGRERLLVQLNAVLNSIHEGVVIIDLTGNVLTMNPAALALHEYASVEEARRPFRWYLKTFELTGPDGLPLPYRRWPVARAVRGERFADYEVGVRRKDTGKSWVASVNGTPVQDADGVVILFVITLRDITGPKRAREEIARLNADLAARAAELEAANRELEAFNYTVAHDLRKPLTTISGFCQVLQEMCGSRLDNRCRTCIQEIFDGTWRMNRLIDALLDFSHLAHAEPRCEPVDLSALAEEIAADLHLESPERCVTFRISPGVAAYGDPGLLRVVLDNLLGNAWKYTGNREEAVIEFGAADVDGQPACYVHDNGRGFDMAEASRLFAPFQRLCGAGDCDGFGIGLATVERIVKRHGGRVWAVGAPGAGATFYFTLGGISR